MKKISKKLIMGLAVLAIMVGAVGCNKKNVTSDDN